MRLHRFTIDEAEKNPSARVFHHKRRFWSWYPDDEDESKEFGGHIETIVQKPEPTFSARLHIGTKSSETPWDGHLTILGSGLYWGIETSGKIADRLTRCTKHPYEGRDLKVAIHDGRIWFEVWTHPRHHQNGEFAKWRHSNFHLNPLDALLGEQRYWYEDIESVDIGLRMPEGEYPAKMTLQRQTFGRPKAKKRVEAWTVDVDVPKGVPYCVDRSGGWKGDRAYGFAVNLRQKRANWHVDAQAAAEAWVLQRRAETGFRQPDPVEAPSIE
ncbi:hypothetical protein [Nocardia niwae]|uniref:hypothetical protein n=1 Tax=Nocardia niwae TaxID=626084 RepID=UPI0007A45E2F|nr:hypothetical protein [Nocardia niwae]